MPIKSPEVGIRPNPEVIIWRYLELDKFQSMLERKALFFCRAGMFSDPFEGSLPQKVYDTRLQARREIDDFRGIESTQEQIAKSVDNLTQWHLEFRSTHVVNCWHMNTNESDAMWQLYLKSNAGVAIQTTVAQLLHSLQGTPQNIDISKIRYIDYESDVFYHPIEYPHRGYNLLTPLIHKRKEYLHERELRLIYEVNDTSIDPKYWENQEYKSGILINIDINLLINKIILPPTSDEAVRKDVEAIAEKYGYKFIFEKSTLSKPVLF